MKVEIIAGVGTAQFKNSRLSERLSVCYEVPQLKYMKQSFPAHAARMKYSVGIGKKALANLSGSQASDGASRDI